jgi:CMP-N-acetylneuraminic acid synthetase
MNKKILGLIPARGGSKGIPNKNIIDLNGKPLINYSINAAKESDFLTKLIVSTDSKEIADIAQLAGANIPFLRPETLSTDSSAALGVIEHAIDYFASIGEAFDYIVYLQPTSPLRTKEDIDQAIIIMRNSDADSLVSVTDVPHQFGVESLMVEDMNSNEKWVSPLANNQVTKNALRRQEKPHYVARNGPAIVITQPNTIKQFGNFYGNKVASYKMPANRSADIDNIDDLDYVSWLMDRR